MDAMLHHGAHDKEREQQYNNARMRLEGILSHEIGDAGEADERWEPVITGEQNYQINNGGLAAK